MATDQPALPPLAEILNELRELQELRPERSSPFRLKLLASSWNISLVNDMLYRAWSYLLSTNTECVPKTDKATVDRLSEDVSDLMATANYAKVDARLHEYQTSNLWRMPFLFSTTLVPGALELPLAARRAAAPGVRLSRRAKNEYHGVLAMGVVIRGETEHFNLVSRECSAGLSKVSLRYGIPVISGLLAVENAGQAKERIKQGHVENWVHSLLYMVMLMHSKEARLDYDLDLG